MKIMITDCHDVDDFDLSYADAIDEHDKSPAEMREEKRNISMTERGVTRTLVSLRLSWVWLCGGRWGGDSPL